MLRALSEWLKKAQAQIPEADAEALLSARLAPDMFPLSTQIRFACVQAQEAVFRLQGKPFPESINELLEEGRHAGERPGSLADAQPGLTKPSPCWTASPPTRWMQRRMSHLRTNFRTV
tara:strand:- start:208743 stop:209096 length:354 start_codon:yes stop_codon:yes gene_type:complete